MERKKASDFPPEVLRLFDGYVHGAISRRDFLDRAAKFAIGGLTAGAMLESLRPNYAFAQQIAKDEGRLKTEYLSYPSAQGSGRRRVSQVASRLHRENRCRGILLWRRNRQYARRADAGSPCSGSLLRRAAQRGGHGEDQSAALDSLRCLG